MTQHIPSDFQDWISSLEEQELKVTESQPVAATKPIVPVCHNVLIDLTAAIVPESITQQQNN